MLFQKEFDELHKHLENLNRSADEVKNLDLIPLSFFSSSIDSLKNLKSLIYEIEIRQFQLMEQHLKKTEADIMSMDFDESDQSPSEKIEVPKEAFLPKEEFETQKEENNLIQKTSESKAFVASAIEQEHKPALADSISKKIFPDIKKSLSLNDKFMFQRDLFNGDNEAMNIVLDRLNSHESLNDAIRFINSTCSISWDSEAGVLFRDLLEKRFA